MKNVNTEFPTTFINGSNTELKMWIVGMNFPDFFVGHLIKVGKTKALVVIKVSCKIYRRFVVSAIYHNNQKYCLFSVQFK